MSDDKHKNENNERKIYSHATGKYSVVDGKDIYSFEFPISSTLEKNFSVITFIKHELFKNIQKEINKEKTASTSDSPKSK